MNMNKDLPDIEELFKSALADNEERPSSKVWDGIENILDKDDVVSIRKKYNNIKKITVLLFFLLIGLSIYEINTRHSEANLTIINPAKNFELNTDSKGKTKTTHDSHYSRDKINLNSNTLAEKNNDKSGKNKNRFDKSHTANLYGSHLNENPNENSDNKRNKREEGLSDANVMRGRNTVFTIPLSSSPGQSGKNLLTDDAVAFKINDLLSLNEKSSLIIKDEKSTQESAKKKDNKNSRFSVTAYLSPDFASYRLQDDEQNNQGENAAELEKNERHEFSSTIGALIEYRFKKHLSIESGLTFSNTNITVEPKVIYAQAVNSSDVKYRLNTSSGYGYVLPSFSRTPSVGDSLYAFTSTHTLQYIGLPVLFKADIRYRKFDFNIMTGAAANFLIKGKIETSVENGTSNEPEVVGKLYGLKKIYFSGLTGFGVSYHINDKIAISLSPAFRYALNSINKNTPVKSYPNSLMFPIGLKIQL